jgi:hypothetical protein
MSEASAEFRVIFLAADFLPLLAVHRPFDGRTLSDPAIPDQSGTSI